LTRIPGMAYFIRMPDSWSVEFLNDAVQHEFMALPVGARAKFMRIAELIEDLGLPSVGMPHVKQVEGKLWEMRTGGADGHARGFYTAAPGKRVVLLRFYNKKSNKAPKREVRLALERMEDTPDA
jgi:phage-related protein